MDVNSHSKIWIRCTTYTVIYGLAALSRLPSPLPMMKIAAQKPPKEWYNKHGQATKAREVSSHLAIYC